MPAEVVLSFWVSGVPATQGSKRVAVSRAGYAYMFEATSRTLKPWRESIVSAAMLAVMPADVVRRRAFPMVGAVHVELGFVLPRAKSNRDPYPVGARTGDIDKLARAVLDALAERTGAGVFVNDSQVKTLNLDKRYARPGEEPGVSVSVRTV